MKDLRFWTSYRDRSPGFWMKWLGLDGSRYRLVWDAARPDYVIATPHIYTSDAVRNEFARPYKFSIAAENAACPQDTLVRCGKYALVRDSGRRVLGPPMGK